MTPVEPPTVEPPGDGLVLQSRPRSLGDLVYDTIYRAIVSQHMAPGEVVTEPGLAERLQVSKTPVREALLRLREIGLIEGDGPRGLCVVRRSVRKIEQAYEVREALEPFMAVVFARRAHDQPREELRRIAAASVVAAERGELYAFRTYDTGFHTLIASTMDNPRLTGPNEVARALINVLRDRDFPQAPDLVGCAQEHVETAGAIGAGDLEHTRRSMVSHIRNTRRLLLVAAERPPQ